MDPQNNGNIVRTALLVEGLLNLLSFPFLTHTVPILRLVLNNPAHINPASVFFTRFFGGVVTAGLSTALFACLPNTRGAIESRRTAYLILGWGEVVLIPVLILEMMKGEPLAWT